MKKLFIKYTLKESLKFINRYEYTIGLVNELKSKNFFVGWIFEDNLLSFKELMELENKSTMVLFKAKDSYLYVGASENDLKEFSNIYNIIKKLF